MAERKRHPQPPRKKKKVVVKKAPTKGASTKPAVDREDRAATAKASAKPKPKPEKKVILRKRQDKPTPPYKTTQAKPSSLKKKPTYTSKRPAGFDPLVDALGPRPRRNIVEDSEWSPERFGPIRNTAEARPLNPESRRRIREKPLTRAEMLAIALEDAIRRNPNFAKSAEATGLSDIAKLYLGESLVTPGFNPRKPMDWIDPFLVYADIASFGGTAPLRTAARSGYRAARYGREAVGPASRAVRGLRLPEKGTGYRLLDDLLSPKAGILPQEAARKAAAKALPTPPRGGHIPNLVNPPEKVAARLASRANPKNVRAATNAPIKARPVNPSFGGVTIRGRVHVAGPSTPAQWLKRVNQFIPDPEVQDEWARWYEVFEQEFRPFFGEDADAIMRGFMMSQKNTSPSGGLGAVLKVMDRIRRGEEVGSEGIGMIADGIRRAVENEPISSDFGAKLSDFADALAGSPKRRWMGLAEEAGAPAPGDIHAARDFGFVDPKWAARLEEEYGLVRGVDFEIDLPSGSLSGPNYEAVQKWYTKIAKYLNRRKYHGREDWTPAQAQALGWGTIQLVGRRTPESLGFARLRNTSRIDTELTQGIHDLGRGLSRDQQVQVFERVKPQIHAMIDATPGVYRDGDAFFDVSGWHKGLNGSVHVNVIGEERSIRELLRRLSTALDQSEIQASREVFSDQSRSALRISSPAFADPAVKGEFFTRLASRSKRLDGFMPDGPDAIMIRTGREGLGQPKVPEFLQKYADDIEAVSREMGIDVDYGHKNIELLKEVGTNVRGPDEAARAGGRVLGEAVDDTHSALLRRELEDAIASARGAGRAADEVEVPEVLYHVAPAKRRGAIAREGLRTDTERTYKRYEAGNYFFADREDALKYMTTGPRMYGDWDIWAVRSKDLGRLEPDPFFENLSPEDADKVIGQFGRKPKAFILRSNVEPEKIGLSMQNPWFENLEGARLLKETADEVGEATSARASARRELSREIDTSGPEWADWNAARAPYEERGITVYRGMKLSMPSEYDVLGAAKMTDEEIEQSIRWAIEGNHKLDWKGIGVHWTTDRTVAEEMFARASRGKVGRGSYGLIIEAQVLPEDIVQNIGRDAEKIFGTHAGVLGPKSVEKELTVRPGARIRILDGTAKLPDGSIIRTDNMDDILLDVGSQTWLPDEALNLGPAKAPSRLRQLLDPPPPGIASPHLTAAQDVGMTFVFPHTRGIMKASKDAARHIADLREELRILERQLATELDLPVLARSNNDEVVRALRLRGGDRYSKIEHLRGVIEDAELIGTDSSLGFFRALKWSHFEHKNPGWLRRMLEEVRAGEDFVPPLGSGGTEGISREVVEAADLGWRDLSRGGTRRTIRQYTPHGQQKTKEELAELALEPVPRQPGRGRSGSTTGRKIQDLYDFLTERGTRRARKTVTDELGDQQTTPGRVIGWEEDPVTGELKPTTTKLANVFRDTSVVSPLRRSASAYRRSMDVYMNDLSQQVRRHEQIIAKALPKKWRPSWTGGSIMPKHSLAYLSMEEALWACLEVPKSWTPDHAIRQKMRWLRRTLEYWKEINTEEAEKARHLLTRQHELLEHALKQTDRLESKEFARALDEAAIVAEKSEQIFKEVTGLSDEVLDARRNGWMRLLVEEGLVQENVLTERARAYLPHADYMFYGTLRGTGVPVGGVPRVLGIPKKKRGVFNLEKWSGHLAKRGSVNTSIRQLTDLYRNRLRYQQMMRVKEDIYEIAQPITEEVLSLKRPPADWALIRNPNAPLPEKLTPMMKQAMANPDQFIRRYGKESFDDINDQLNELFAEESFWEWFGDEPKKWVSWSNEQGPSTTRVIDSAWEADFSPENTRMIEAKVASQILGDAVIQQPFTSYAGLLAFMNSMARSNYIYFPYFGGVYVTRNSIQNMVLLGLTQPTAFSKMKKSTHIALRDKELFDLLTANTGTVKAQAGLPDAWPSNLSRLNRGAEWMTDKSRAIGGALGAVSDEPWRIANMLQRLKRYGVNIDKRDEIIRVLRSEEPGTMAAVENMRQAVRNDMLDFDVLPPYVKDRLTRYFFIFPFRLAAWKWPILYAREYPFRSALLALPVYWGYTATNTEGIPQGSRERTRIPDSVPGVGGIDVGWVDPVQPSLETFENLYAVARASASPDMNVSGLKEWLQPWMRTLLQSSESGVSWGRLFDPFVPTLTMWKKIARGGDLQDQVLRALGSGIEPSRYRRADEAKAREELEDAIDTLEKEYGPLNNREAEAVVRSFQAYQEFLDLDERSNFASKDLGRKSNGARNKLILLSTVAASYWAKPSDIGAYGFKNDTWPDEERVRAADIKDVEKALRNLRAAIQRPYMELIDSYREIKKYREETGG